MMTVRTPCHEEKKRAVPESPDRTRIVLFEKMLRRITFERWTISEEVDHSRSNLWESL